MLDPALRQLIGPEFEIAKHIDKVIVVVVGLSVLPMVWKGWKAWRAKNPEWGKEPVKK